METDSGRALARRQLQRQHRVEEVGERFGFAFVTEGDVARLGFGALARVKANGAPLSAAEAPAWAAEAGVACDADGLALPLDGSISEAELEESLLRLFGRLVESDPLAFLRLPRKGARIPREGTLPESARWLERFYGDGALPREKKQAVVDLRRSQGPYLRSVDDDPLQIIDAASQIASLAAGFRPPNAQRALDEGRFDPFLGAALDIDDPRAIPAVEAFSAALREVAPPGLEHVLLVNAGSEANEKALEIARRHGPGGRRVLAFEGSFHGRTLLSLFATWNPSKRAPYELPGFEAIYHPFPVADESDGDPFIEPGWREGWSDPDGARDFPAEDDPLLAAEVASLLAVEASIRAGDVLAVLIEPYQCEGGDRRASRRFFHGLRALTRGHGVPLIFDEVQSGFGLGGPFFWCQHFNLLDAGGRPDGPDLLTGAKRAQVGYVLSRWPDPEPTTTHVASLVRGLAHIEAIHSIPPAEDIVRKKLWTLLDKWDHVLSNPRVHGDAFAFDMPTAAAANHLINQRFYRGYMVYLAGESTLRYRMNRSMERADIDLVFAIIDRSLEALVEQAGGEGPDLIERISACKAPAWEAPAATPGERSAPTLSEILADPSSKAADRAVRVYGELSAASRAAAAAHLGLEVAELRGRPARAALSRADATGLAAAVGVPAARVAADALGTRIRRLDLAGFDALVDDIEALQADTYEPERQDDPSYLRTLVQADGGICLVAEDPVGLVAIAFAGPLELWPAVDGPRQDPHRGRGDTLYSADLTVSRRAQGRGVGLRLRAALLKLALAARRPDGRPRYAFVTGRNRLGFTETMWRLNQKVGAYEVAIYPGQYGAREAITRYYRIPLRRFDRRPFEVPAVAGRDDAVVDMAAGIALPTGAAHPLLTRARQLGVFDEPALTKLTISNFITRPFARYAEYLRLFAPPSCGRMYFTSSPDEMADKSLRALRTVRAAGRVAVGLSGGYVGHTTAVARSISDPATLRQPGDFFGWPRVPHPAEGGWAQTRAALDAVVARHGADAVLGIYVEAVQARTGRVLADADFLALCAFRDETGIPVVLSETTTGLGRSGRGAWWHESAGGAPDMVLLWAGGQIGHIFCNDRTFVDKPLTLISTWDGDELSATRLLWQLYALEGLDVADRARRLDAALASVSELGAELGGLGLYRTIRLNPLRATAMRVALAEVGVRVAQPTSDLLAFVPPLTAEAGDFERLAAALRDLEVPE